MQFANIVQFQFLQHLTCDTDFNIGSIGWVAYTFGWIGGFYQSLFSCSVNLLCFKKGKDIGFVQIFAHKINGGESTPCLTLVLKGMFLGQ